LGSSWHRWLNRPAARWRRFLRDVSFDLGATALAAYVALALVSTGALELRPDVLLVIAIASCVHVFVLFNRGIYSLNPRYLGVHDVMLFTLACMPAALIIAVGESQLRITGHGAGILLVFLLYLMLANGALVGIRGVARIMAWHGKRKVNGSRRRVLVVGAGDAGELMVRELSRSQYATVKVVGFVDDSDAKQSLRIHGLPVMGKTADIPALVETESVDEIMIAIPQADGESMKRIFSICQKTTARIRTLPGLRTVFDQSASLSSQLREVEIQDLLRRDPVQTNLQDVARYINGETVLVTGGGGSIGSELARQVAHMSCANVILVGKGENSIYEIEQELIQTSGIQPKCVIADVRDRRAMEQVFKQYKPTVIFHAAAHKHVPLMQGNIREAVMNNILGTLNVAELAASHGARKFILISTDKAVNPSSIMGATKRVCEMIVSAFGAISETEFASVRFGNVLGSRGSLIPLLTAQIKRGGPVTVTHPDMTRYFMTIPEAVQLVLQAGAIGTSGEIFILDMGDPVKIEDLALELIRLHGLVPGQDIAIKYTGVRPGEKLHEELVYDKETLKQTSHPKIRMVAKPDMLQLSDLRRLIDLLVEQSNQSPDQAKQVLMEVAWGRATVAGYLPPTSFDPPDVRNVL
jgi:FlaA1/EpsC-like NDP-sugar epimerase